MIGARTLGAVFFRAPLPVVVAAPPTPAPRAKAISAQSAPHVVERCRPRHAPAERRECPPLSLAELARRAGVSLPVAQTWRESWDCVPPRCAAALRRAMWGTA